MRHHRRSAGFTLVEILVVAGLLVVLMTVLVSMTNQTQRLIRSTSSKIEQFQQARVAFESMSRKLGQATLNTFWDYEYPAVFDSTTGYTFTNTTLVPNRYRRNSDLRFRTGPMSGVTATACLNPAYVGAPSPSYPAGNPQVGIGVMFHAPFGLVSNQLIYGALDTAINTWGYYLEIGDDSATLPTFIADPGAPSASGSQPALVPVRRRYRLMELMVPTEELTIFKPQAQFQADRSWFLPFINGTTPRTRVAAENIVLLIVYPRLTATDEKAWMTINGVATTPNIAKQYLYDTTVAGQDESVTPNTIGWLNSLNQLPAVLQVIMVAIDETSAKQLQDRYPLTDTVNGPGLGITVSTATGQQYVSTGGVQLFTQPNGNAISAPYGLEDVYSGAIKNDGDLSRFEALLQSRRVSYRIFSSKISIRGSKWSRVQNQ